MTRRPTTSGAYAGAVAAWSDHLRAGGTTPWSQWCATTTETATVTGTGTRTGPGPVPDAPHLELLRRLNGAAGSPPAALADLVLSTPAPGRGLVDVPLPWPGRAISGTPALDPETLPAEELVRVAVGVLVRLLPGVRLTEPEATPARWPLPGRPRFRVHGAPLTAAVLRRGLLAAGQVESDWRPRHVVIALPVGTAMAEHWTAATRSGGILTWRTLWRRAVAADRLPPPIDVVGTAERLHASGVGEVHVVVARDRREAVELVDRITDARLPAAEPASPDPSRADLLRRVNRVGAIGSTAALTARRLDAVLAGVERPPAPPVGVPRAAREWAGDATAALVSTLNGADYAVHGDPGAVTLTGDDRRGRVDPDRTLELALAACLRTWQLQEGRD